MLRSSTFRSLTAMAVFLLSLVSVTTSYAQDSYAPRAIIGMQSIAPDFRQIVAAMCDPATKMVDDVELHQSNIYLRLTERRFVLNKDGKLNDGAFLGGTPFVFLTVPQAGFGRSLYGMYSDLGYDATGILQQQNVNMVALVIRYKSDIQFSGVREGDGPLDGADYRKHVYVPTWKNAYALFANLAGETPPPAPKDSESAPFNPRYMNFDNDAHRSMARYFPAERRTHISQLPYSLLRTAGGSDWDYRQLLESKMSMNSHFRGVGITENTLSPADNRQGLPEFVGPNQELSELQDYAVIDVGRMEFTEVHD